MYFNNFVYHIYVNNTTCVITVTGMANLVKIMFCTLSLFVIADCTAQVWYAGYAEATLPRERKTSNSCCLLFCVFYFLFYFVLYFYFITKVHWQDHTHNAEVTSLTVLDQVLESVVHCRYSSSVTSLLDWRFLDSSETHQLIKLCSAASTCHSVTLMIEAGGIVAQVGPEADGLTNFAGMAT